MTLIKADSFDHYATAQMSQKWNSSATGTVSTTSPRTGRACMLGGLAKHVFPSGDAHATYILGLALYRADTGTPICDYGFYGDAGATQHLNIRVEANGAITVKRGTSSGTTIGTVAAGAIPLDAWSYIEMKALLSDTVGTVEVRLNGNPTPVLALTAQDTKNAGTLTTFDSVTVVSGGSGSPVIRVDDVYICNGAGSVNNDFLGDTEIVCLLPNGDGATVNGTPSTGSSHFALVDELTPNGITDYNTLVTDGDLDLYDFEDLTNTGGTIRGIQTIPNVAKVGTDATFIQDTLRISGVNYSAASVAVSTTFLYYPRIREISPATSAAFTAAIINAMQHGAMKKDT